ncbi:SDR family NAD(P)-dependent oxidoreductase [Kitasatospora fiedleri]|uniref:SDR family NAD(P)-dependent oxidoreductase n=1 Tax=Kitasatospora fiedleri TaxID=2991545 RepID=UPI000C2C32B2|nr:SDR family NAD(P)-dependent oxidoreductase [Kitasatospora fiedleri]
MTTAPGGPSGAVAPVALVTGATRGLGREIARQLAERGYTVFAAARDEERGRRTAAELAAAGDVRPLRLDVTDHDSVRAAAEAVAAESDRLDLLVNNAGITGIPRGTLRPVEDLTVDDLRAVLETNLVGPFAVTQALLPLLRKASGRVVNLTSSLATFARTGPGTPPGRPDLLPYNVSKAGLNMATVLYAAALRDSGVTVHAVSPGFVATDMNNHTGTRTAEEGAAAVLRLATTPADELPDRSFLTEGGPIPW